MGFWVSLWAATSRYLPSTATCPLWPVRTMRFLWWSFPGLDHLSGQEGLQLLWGKSQKDVMVVSAFLGARAPRQHPHRKAGETPALPGWGKRTHKAGTMMRAVNCGTAPSMWGPHCGATTPSRHSHSCRRSCPWRRHRRSRSRSGGRGRPRRRPMRYPRRTACEHVRP